MRRVLAIVTLLAVLSAPHTVSFAQQAGAAQPAPTPPSSLELRLREHAARQQRYEAGREAREESRLRRLTGSGEPAGAREVEVTAVGAVTAGTAVRIAVGGILVLAAMAALQADSAHNR